MGKEKYFYGIHAVNALIETKTSTIDVITVQANRQDQRLKKLLQEAEKHDIKVVSKPRRELDTMVADKNHQGVVATVSAVKTFNEGDLDDLIAKAASPILLLVLDGVQDPHNLGACLRSANAFGVHAVVAPKDRAVGMTPAVMKVACGAEAYTPFITVTNLARTLRDLQERGIWLVGATEKAESVVSDIDLSGDIALIMGGEGQGLRRLTKKHCDFLAKIPMDGQLGSINVSAATAVCLYEVQRQRT